MNPRYPGAIWVGGHAAGYTLGRTGMTTVKCHYTVGRNSDPIGQQGYFQWLVSRDGTIRQYAEADAQCWDSGEWNGTGPGIEIEYLPGADDAIFTDEARAATGELVKWLVDEWGIPPTYYDGPRVDQPHGGFISHRSLIQSEEHNDYWPREDWDTMLAPPAPPPPAPPEEVDDEMGFTATDENNETWIFAGCYRRKVSWDQANYLAGLAQPVKYQGNISNLGRDAYKDVDA